MSSSRTRRLLAGTALATAAALGGFTVASVNPLGIAGAEEASSSDPAAPGEGRPQILQDVLDQLTDEGVIDQEQNDTIQERVQDEIQAWRDANPPGERPDRPGGGPGGPGGGHGMGLWGAWEAAAEIIGVDPGALRDGLRDGQSIAEIAAAEGVERQALIDAIVAEATTHIDAAVESGWLGAERAEELKDGLPAMAERVIDAKRPPR